VGKSVGLGKQMEDDLGSLKKLLGKGKGKKTYKEMYQAKLKEIEREKEEQFYKMKLETLDKLEFGDDTLGKVKKKLKKLLE
jgi:hypothetical protein